MREDRESYCMDCGVCTTISTFLGIPLRKSEVKYRDGVRCLQCFRKLNMKENKKKEDGLQ